MTGRRAEAGWRPGVWGRSSSTVTSEISTNSKSRILLVTLGGSEAAGLNNPGFEVQSEAGGRTGASVVAVAVAASMSSP